MTRDNSADEQTETEGGRHNKRSFMPWYNDKADYNTNAPSYYDFLARPNYYWKLIGKIINRLLRRDIVVKETPTITMNKLTSWQDEGEDNITLSADVHISKQITHEDEMNLDMPNAITALEDGIYVPSYLPLVKANYREINLLKDRVTKVEGRVKVNEDNIVILQDDVSKLKTRMTTAEGNINKLRTDVDNLTAVVQANQVMLYKIVDNLIKTGAWSGSRNDGNIATGRDIASGNINLFSGNEGNNNAIFTHSGVRDNDLQGGR